MYTSDLEYKVDVSNLYVLPHREHITQRTHDTENIAMTSATTYAVPVYLLEVRCRFVPNVSTALMKPFMALDAHNHEVPVVR